MLAVVDQGRCSGCGACLAFCPVDCIEIVPEAGFARFGQSVEIDIERCIGCSLCAKHCPWEAIAVFPVREAVEKVPELTLRSVLNHLTRSDEKPAEPDVKPAA